MAKIKANIYAQALYEISQSAGNLDLKLQNFAKVLASHNKLCMIDEIIEYFARYYGQAKHIIDAQIETAYELDEAGKKEIVKLIKEIQPAEKVDLQIKIRPQLLGGFVVNFADWQIDASLKGKLQIIKNNIK